MKQDRTEVGKPFKLLFSHDVQARPGETYTRTDSTGWIFEFIISGTGTLRIDNSSYEPGPSDMYILPNGLGHSYSADMDDPWRKLYFIINGPLVSDLMKAYRMAGVYYVQDCGCEHWFRSILALLTKSTENANGRAAIILHEMLVHLAARQTEAEGIYSPAVQRALKFIQASLERPVGMKDIAGSAGMSSSHLTRVFHRETGMSPYDFLIKLRMDQACTLLTLPQLKISAIAERLCYADAYYFSNAFKQRFGLSPLAFRKQETGC